MQVKHTQLNDDESRCDEDDTTTSKAPVGITLTFWQHFYTPLRCASCRHGCTWISTHTHTHTHTQRRYTHTHRKQTTNKQTDTRASKHSSISILSELYSLFPSCLFFFFPPSCFHIQTHSHSGGVIECDSKSWEGCWRVIRLTCEMEPTWHQQVGSDTYSRHGWITPAKTGG